jgi:hypothetical protein
MKHARVRNFQLILTALFSLVCLNATNAQSDMLNASDSSCLYIPLNEATSLEINRIAQSRLCLSFEDKYGEKPQFDIRILDWQNREVARKTLDKYFGLNLYSLNLKTLLGDTFQEEVLFNLVSANDMGQELSFYFMAIAPDPDLDKPNVEIIAEEIEVYCEELRVSEVNYYAAISGGSPPYELTWFVFKGTTPETLIYQPKKVVLQDVADIPFTRVSAALDYYVAVHIRDGCGAERDKVVHVICDNVAGKLNLIFEPINLDQFKGFDGQEIGGVN